MLAEMVVGLGVDASKLASGLAGAEKSVGGFAGKAKSVGTGMAKTGAAMSLGITAPLAMMAKIGIGELGDIEAANTQTAAALGRIGAKSLVSVGGVQKLAGALQAKSGIDDQVIQSGQNMLLTLGNIDTKTAQGAKTFKTASSAMVNFAEATGTDAAGAGKLFAKSIAAAGNGVLLLPKGVKLSAAETAKLTAVMKSGASAGTKQAAVVEALGKKFEGSAKLTSTEKWAVMQDQFAGIAASLVEQLMPAISGLTDWLGKVMDKFNSLSPGQKKFIAFGALAVAAIGPVIGIVGTLVIAFGALAGAATALGVSMLTVVLVPLAIIAAIALLVAAGVLLYKHWDEVKAKAVEIWNAIKSGISGIITGIGTWMAGAWDAIQAKVVGIWGAIKDFLAAHLVLVAAVITGPLGALAVWIYQNWDAIKAAASTAWNAIKTMLSTAASAVANAIKGGVDNVLGFLSAIWTSVKTGVTTAWTAITTTAGTLASGVANAIKGGVDNVIALVSGVWTSVKTGLASAWGTIQDTAGTWGGKVAGAIVGGFKDLVSDLGAKGSAAGTALANGIKSAINSIIRAWNGVEFTLPKISLPDKLGGGTVGGQSFGTPNIPELAKGGILSSPTAALMAEYRGANHNPEVVAPLDRLLGIMQSAMGGSGGGVTIHINGPISSERDARMYGQAIVRELRLQGVNP